MNGAIGFDCHKDHIGAPQPGQIKELAVDFETVIVIFIGVQCHTCIAEQQTAFREGFIQLVSAFLHRHNRHLFH